MFLLKPLYMILGSQFRNEASLTPITHKRVDAITSLVVRDGIDISISPSTGLDGLKFIIGRLDLEPLHEAGESHCNRGYSTTRWWARVILMITFLIQAGSFKKAEGYEQSIDVDRTPARLVHGWRTP